MRARASVLLVVLALACAEPAWDGAITPTITDGKPAPTRPYRRLHQVHVDQRAPVAELAELGEAIAAWNAALPAPLFVLRPYALRPTRAMLPCGDVVLELVEEITLGPADHPYGTTYTTACEHLVRVVDRPDAELSDTVAHELGHTLYLPDETADRYSVPHDRSLMYARSWPRRGPRPVILPRHVAWVRAHFFAGYDR